ncbi:MAG TPA: asparagine synthase (glutamine-hydrolyzing) [Candidatus Acidoferrales bacterium]|jgi:asparagine synthase (glutamine-hydrolysing)|nr:asparagine synthase (glutamine-hydrolyzing) [Candidatus Acidoferrales bacterium]
MCGICGVIGIQRSELAEAITRRMMGALRHRGPDEDGILVAPSAALGMRRLSIIDLPGGHQPVFNETSNLAVVFNGEIYNFPQLRKTLAQRGHAFRTHSDTEVIVHAYEEWGEQCLRELRGMFAIAIWDARSSDASGGASGEVARRGRIFLARDRLGIKPLYYASSDGALLFSSEVRSLLASGRLQPRLSPDSLEAFLTFGSVAEPSTLVEGVFSVPPGHFLAFSVDAPPERPSPTPYWEYSDAVLSEEGPKPKNIQEAAKLLRPLLEETVRDHLIADVPLGVFLSSGLDSTSLVALASRVQSDLRTFTVIFPEQQYSEAKISRETAKRFKTRHEEILLSPDMLAAHLGDAVSSLDQPTMDGLNTYFVSRAARQSGLKVALSGLGSDEIFGGYSTFASTPRAEFVAGLGRWIPSPFRRLTAAAAVRIAAGDAVRKAAAAWRSPTDFPHAYYFTRLLFTPSRVRRLLAPYFESHEHSGSHENAWRARMRETSRRAGRLDSFTSVSCFELQSYMVNTLLRDTDAASMANSLEVRVPFLDHRLVEFVGRLPKYAKYATAVPKSLLVEALSDLLPEEVVGQSKRTFTLPWDVWLRGSLGVRLSQDLANLTPPLQRYLNPRAVRGAWQSFVVGQTNWSRPWSLYVLNEWVRHHVTDAANTPVSSADAVHASAVSATASNSRS